MDLSRGPAALAVVIVLAIATALSITSFILVFVFKPAYSGDVISPIKNGDKNIAFSLYGAKNLTQTITENSDSAILSQQTLLNSLNHLQTTAAIREYKDVPATSSGFFTNVTFNRVTIEFNNGLLHGNVVVRGTSSVVAEPGGTIEIDLTPALKNFPKTQEFTYTVVGDSEDINLETTLSTALTIEYIQAPDRSYFTLDISSDFFPTEANTYQFIVVFSMLSVNPFAESLTAETNSELLDYQFSLGTPVGGLVHSESVRPTSLRRPKVARA